MAWVFNYKESIHGNLKSENLLYNMQVQLKILKITIFTAVDISFTHKKNVNYI